MERLPGTDEIDVEMLFNFNDLTQWIDLKVLYSTEGEVKPYGIPTSFFRQPDNEAFAWGTIGLVGCTMYIVIKLPTLQDPTPGVYMAHIWE